MERDVSAMQGLRGSFDGMDDGLILIPGRIAHHIIKPAKNKGMAMAKSDANASAHLM